ncbi:ATP-dependent RNA helicase A [Nannizzia gypsea CBS 118893]|uniref:ATP-dependent RNA helicase A n=1 Tax=Arthroderma gypseum (strain ATCC MYA-4604 / CBS 118893) TaxID=535722 RepID=E4V2W3_ARTGP|nr:ATP-dependent RNA helicase A [Nannizzia gypsea CBS 118893]EFR04337.1 ATP-dependent RNA helicase A [Nannizzia gypsea CBS 118893]
MPAIPLRLSLRNVRHTRKVPGSPYGQSLNAVYRVSHSNGYRITGGPGVSRIQYVSPCTSRGYITDRTSPELSYNRKPQPQSHERSVSTQAVDNRLLAGDPSVNSSPTESVIYPEPYSRLTEAHARENAALPSSESLLALPTLLSKPQSSLYALSQMGIVEIDTDVAKLSDIGAVMCKLVCRITPASGVGIGEPIEVAGLGQNSRSAENAAYVFLVSALHTKGYLNNIVKSFKALRDTRAHHFDLSDVYHYASRYAILPEVHCTSTPDPGFTSYAQHEVRIELPAQNIRSVATGNILPKVVSEAARSFIAQISQQDIPENQGQVIPDSAPLTVDIAPNFLNFYLSKCNQSSEIESRCTQEKAGASTVYYGTLFIDGQPVSNPVMADSPKSAKSLARFAGAVHLIGKDPSIWPEFITEVRETAPLVHSVSVSMSPATLCAIQSSLESIYYPKDQAKTEETPSSNIESLFPNVLASAVRQAESTEPTFLPFSDRTLEETLHARNSLPTRQHAKEILDTINENTVSIIVGSTGSGKTSQIPQMVLEQSPDSHIMVTQPRRVTTTTIARRVAFERGEALGKSVGYEIRWDAIKPSSNSGITYRTTGVMLLDMLRRGDEILDTVSHIFVDETHERDTPTDLLLALLRREINRRTNASMSVPKIIIMTADPETAALESYMGTVSENGESTPATRMEMPNSHHPVQRYFLEDILHSLFSTHSAEDLMPLLSDTSTSQHIAAEKNLITPEPSKDNDEAKLPIPNALLEEATANSPISEKEHFVPLGLTAATIAHIAKTEDEGVILALFPGLDVMKRLEKLLYEHPLGIDFSDEAKFQIFKLHSGLGDIDETVLRPAKEGCRKIILSTNIAENSINIPEVRYVVDSGKKHDSVYDPSTGLRKVVGGWVDKLAIHQREACASRTGNGSYYATFTQSRYDTLTKSAPPRIYVDEIETESLQLRATLPNLPLRDFMRQVPNPPSLDRLNSTTANLQSIGAIDNNGDITALGRILSLLPVPLKAGRMVMLGILLRCLEPALVLGAATHARSLFIPSRSERWYNSPRRKFAGDTNSDHIAILRAYRKIRQISNRDGQDAARKYCLQHSMSHATYLDMELFISRITLTLRHLNLIPATESESGDQLQKVLNENSGDHSVLRALITATVTPNIAIKPSDSGGQWHTKRFPAAVVSNKSTNSFQKSWAGRMLAFNEALNFHSEADAIMMDTTTIHPLMACLFGGNLAREDNALFLDSHLAVKVKSPDGTLEGNSKAASAVVKARKLIDKASEDFFNDLASNRSWREAESDRRTLATQIKSIIDTLPDTRQSGPLIRNIP